MDRKAKRLEALCSVFYYTFTSKMKIKGQKVLNHNYKLSAIVVRANYTFL